MQISISCTCQRCGGTGTASDPEGFGYAELYERAREVNRENAPGRTIQACNRLCEQRLAELDLDQYPPEEGPCPTCGATGRVTDLFDEEELAAALEARDRALLDAQHIVRT
jgi:rRNA maturation protein Nop10